MMPIISLILHKIIRENSHLKYFKKTVTAVNWEICSLLLESEVRLQGKDVMVGTLLSSDL